MARPGHVFLIAGEASGDLLGALLMRALRAERPDIRFSGVGGEAMAREGLASLFPLGDIAVMGLVPVLRRLPRLLERIDRTARAVVETQPDCLVLIDAPDFTHRVARRVRRARPELPILDYVSPTVWAWRPGRARAMRDYIDEVLAVLPFEPAAHLRLGGPACVHVGHPLLDCLDALTPSAAELAAREEGRPLLLVLPGSRRAEVARLMPPFGETLATLAARCGPLDVGLPVVPHVAEEIEARLAGWPLRPRLLSQEEKPAAFRRARAALVASGAATLELALAGVPMVVAYKVAPIEWPLRVLIRVDSIVLPNLVLGERLIPEFLQQRAEPKALAAALEPLLRGGGERAAQSSGLERVRERMLADGRSPSARAAERVLAWMEGRANA
ncbi:lipid-A-disaccharide synthase [Methylosinus sp. C49]|uniref:lipid-A-disaccharide synthase n=1 Tax=Methylosinus sp. C49 TaxID=2699395 RepID=UPI0013679319|nr:lipid-A-disaccharide synthase [Methylosinus sp. C49]BBU62636.1 lipid-A-disaccharide synthase [Methylosinus sp. C49]